VKVPHFGNFDGDLNVGNGIECQGIVLWFCKSYGRWI
jgi:hypothetical protein